MLKLKMMPAHVAAGRRRLHNKAVCCQSREATNASVAWIMQLP